MKHSFLRRFSSVLAKRPMVVGTLVNNGKVDLQLKAARRASVDVLELRLDTFAQAQGPFQKTYEFGRHLLRRIKEELDRPVLLTLRAHDERGPIKDRQTLSDAHRAEILSRLMPSVDLVDVEIRRREFARRMTVIAGIHGVDAIHSAHHFTGVFTPQQLRKLSAASRAIGPAILKLAVSPRDRSQLEEFLLGGLQLSVPGRILIGMGKVGLPSRLVGYSFGSLLTYGHLGSSAAPGQLPAGELARCVRDIYGD